MDVTGEVTDRRQRLSRLSLAVAAALLIALTWIGTLDAMRAQRQEAEAHVEAEALNLALAFEDQLHRQLLALDQTLRILEREWERDPEHFDLVAWRRRAVVLSDVSLHLFMTDSNGIIRASTRPELVGVDVSRRDYFRYEQSLPADEGKMFIGPSTRGLVTKRWQMNMARRLDSGTGTFAGVIVVSYDTGALTSFYREADLGRRGMLALIGTRDAQLRAWTGPAEVEPGDSLRNTEMFQAVEANPDGRWIGPSAPDGVIRIHAFRQVVDRDLEVVVGFDKVDALAASAAWERGAVIFAVGITLFITMAAWGLLREMRAARTREEVLARDRAILESSNVQLEMARARADAKTAQLQATLAGMSDGVSMLDRDLRLVQWNDHFADYTGVPAAMLRVGLPMEDIVRAQAELGEFGPVDVDAEVARRMALLRAQSQVGTIERSRPDGRILELRRSALPGGGYVTLYADITARKQAEDALRRARELAEAATEAKSRFVAIVSHEIRTPLNTLLNSLALLADTPMSAGQHRMVDMAAQSGEALLALINDILEMSRMEAGRLGLRPSTFALRPLLEGVVEMFRAQAQERGLSVSLSLAPGVPDRLHADPGRMRQVLMNLMSNAAKFSSPGEVVLLAGTTFAGGRTMLRLAVRDPGPAIKPADRAMLFQPFSRLEQSDSAGKPGSGLGLAICQRLVLLMGGEIACSVTDAGGNEFWLTLPIEPIPVQAPASPRRAGPGLRGRAPRSRVLLVEDIPANQLITATLLRREGHMVDVAGSGQQAIEAVARAPYDLVFMDIFMPGMTGLEATRRIRALSGPSRSTPVVALTANVSAEDRARCLDAGMDGMLSKPVEVAKLGDALMEHVWMWGPRAGRPAEQAAQRPAAQTEAPPAQPAPAAPPAPERVEPEVPVLAVDRLAELRDNLPPATLASLIEQCLGEMHERMERMHGSLGGDDLSRIGQEAHALAGMAGSYAMASLDARLRRIMRAASESDLDGVRQEAADLSADFERAEEALRAAMRTELV